MYAIPEGLALLIRFLNGAYEFWTNIGILLPAVFIFFGNKWWRSVGGVLLVAWLATALSLGLPLFNKYEEWQRVKKSKTLPDEQITRPRILGIHIDWNRTESIAFSNEFWRKSYFYPAIFEILWSKQSEYVIIRGEYEEPSLVYGEEKITRTYNKVKTPAYILKLEEDRSVCAQLEGRADMTNLFKGKYMVPIAEPKKIRALSTPVLVADDFGRYKDGCIIADELQDWSPDFEIKVRIENIPGFSVRNLVLRYTAYHPNDGDLIADWASMRINHGDLFDWFAPQYHIYGNPLFIDFLGGVFSYEFPIVRNLVEEGSCEHIKNDKRYTFDCSQQHPIF